MLPEQMQAQVKKLEKWKEEGLDYGKALADAALAGWQGLVEPVHPNRSNVPKPNGQAYHEKITDTMNQIFGRKQNGSGNTVIDITPHQAAGSDPADFPEVRSGVRKALG